MNALRLFNVEERPQARIVKEEDYDTQDNNEHHCHDFSNVDPTLLSNFLAETEQVAGCDCVFCKMRPEQPRTSESSDRTLSGGSARSGPEFAPHNGVQRESRPSAGVESPPEYSNRPTFSDSRDEREAEQAHLMGSHTPLLPAIQRFEGGPEPTFRDQPPSPVTGRRHPNFSPVLTDNGQPWTSPSNSPDPASVVSNYEEPITHVRRTLANRRPDRRPLNTERRRFQNEPPRYTTRRRIDDPSSEPPSYASSQRHRLIMPPPYTRADYRCAYVLIQLDGHRPQAPSVIFEPPPPYTMHEGLNLTPAPPRRGRRQPLHYSQPPYVSGFQTCPHPPFSRESSGSSSDDEGVRLPCISWIISNLAGSARRLYRTARQAELVPLRDVTGDPREEE